MINNPLNKTAGKNYWDAMFSLDSIPVSLFKSISAQEDNIAEHKKQLFKQFVCIVNIETSSYCNRSCTYCPVSTFDRKNQLHMSDNMYSKILNDLHSIKYSSTISLNLYNEPLADSKLYSRIEEARLNCPESFIKFNSNGDFLTRDVLDDLVNVGVNAIFITLHPGAKEKYEDDNRLKHLKRFFNRLQLDYNVDEIIPNTRITSDVYYRGLRLLVQAHNWGVIGNDRGGTIPNLSIDNRLHPCVRPIREFTISFDGSVYPCCQFFSGDQNTTKYKVGTVSSDESIFDIYASNTMSAWRKSLFEFGIKSSPCGSCKDPDFSQETSSQLRSAIMREIENSDEEQILIKKFNYAKDL